MTKKHENKIGARYGNLTIKSVVTKFISKKYRTVFICECDCGSKTETLSYSVMSGRTTSCGCVAKSNSSNRSKIHGMSSSREYKCYHNAKQRCNNPNNKNYNIYGGRGILFEWGSFEEFIDHMGKIPKHKNSLDRIDTNGNYSKGNCRWADSTDQCRNNNRSCLWVIDGKTFKSRRHAAKSLGISQNEVRKRAIKHKIYEDIKCQEQ